MTQLRARRRAGRRRGDGPRHLRAVALPRSALDQGLVTGLATGLHYLLAAGAQDALVATARFLADGTRPGRARAARSRSTAPRCRSGSRCCGPCRRGPTTRSGGSSARRPGGSAPPASAARCSAGRETGARALDDRLRLGGRLASVPLALPVGLGVAYVVDRLRGERAGEPTDDGARRRPCRPSPSRPGSSAAWPASPTASTPSPTCVARRLAGGAARARPSSGGWPGHAGFLAGLGLGASSVWHRAMQRIEAGTSADVPVIERGRGRPVGARDGERRPRQPRVLGAAWAARAGRHALASVRPQPLRDRPAGVPDLSIETVMGEPARAAPVQVYVGLDSAPTPRERVDLAMAELERTGALRPLAARARLADRHRLRQLRRRRRRCST